MPNALQAGVHRRGHPAPLFPARTPASQKPAKRAPVLQPPYPGPRPRSARRSPASCRAPGAGRRRKRAAADSGRNAFYYIDCFGDLSSGRRAGAPNDAGGKRRAAAPLCPARARFCRPGPPRSAGAVTPPGRGAAAGLAGCAEREFFRLSGGAQQRVAIARNRSKPGSSVLADEPTGLRTRKTGTASGPAPYAQRAGENGRDHRARPRAANTCGGRRACHPPARTRGENRPQGSEREVPHPPCPPVWPGARRENAASARPAGRPDDKKGPGGVTPPGPVFQSLNRSMRDQYTLRLT